jgi:hypothetical protein
MLHTTLHLGINVCVCVCHSSSLLVARCSLVADARGSPLGTKLHLQHSTTTVSLLLLVWYHRYIVLYCMVWEYPVSLLSRTVGRVKVEVGEEEEARDWFRGSAGCCAALVKAIIALLTMIVPRTTYSRSNSGLALHWKPSHGHVIN